MTVDFGGLKGRGRPKKSLTSNDPGQGIKKIKTYFTRSNESDLIKARAHILVGIK